MSFDVSADAYGRFMGRYSRPLAEQFARLVDIRAGQRALDVGCGAGALTELLVEVLGAGSVSAIDPSDSFVASIGERLPGADVRIGTAEALPYPADSFDRTLAQLVVHFMSDPRQGLAQMSRVTRPGGVVAANVWDHGGSAGPLAVFWRAVREQEPSAHDESTLPGVREGHLAHLFGEAGMSGATATSLRVEVSHNGFEDWWEPFTFGVGPAGAYVASLDEAGRDNLRERCRAMLPAGPFTLSALAWTVLWTKPSP